MFDSIDRLERVKKNGLGSLSFVVITAALVPLFVCLAFGRQQLGLEAGSFSAGIAIAANLNWKFRLNYWFWAVFSALLAVHGTALLVLRLPEDWKGKEVTILIIPSVLVSLWFFTAAKKLFGASKGHQKVKHI